MSEETYIFPSSDFEDSSFNPAAFVAKYRRVSSLESLKGQLREYSESLKQQLFVIINRDYKDFIGIATKLDGVDNRVEVLRRPLVDLRLDLSSLHDWLMTSLQALDSKMSKKLAIISRKEKIESAIRCLDKLDVAELIIEGNVWKDEAEFDESKANVEGNTALKRRDLAKALGKLQSFYMTSPTTTFGPFQGSSSQQKDIFEVSELERAAYALASARSHLSILQTTHREDIEKDKEKDREGGRKGSIANEADLEGETKRGAETGTTSHTNIILLEQRSNRLVEQLLAKIRGWLEESMVSGEAAVTSSETQEDEAVQERGKKRLLQHCLCALQVMGRLDIAEAAVAESVLPHAKATLTQGRVDGAGGRGSLAGLEQALGAVLRKLEPPLITLLTTAEAMGCDLVIGGVWRPITSLISTRFPSIFSVGIASVLAECFRAFEYFHKTLSKELLGPAYEASLTQRLRTDERVLEFQKRWNRNLYLQLRTQEVSSRLDSACRACGSKGLVTDSLDALYNPTSSTSSVDATPTPTSVMKNKVSDGQKKEKITSVPISPRTLSASEMSELRQGWALPTSPSSSKGFRLALTIACATEAATCFHENVFFTSMASSFLTMAVKCAVRYEAHVCLCINSATPSFPKGPATLKGAVDSAGETVVVSSGQDVDGSSTSGVDLPPATPQKTGGVGSSPPRTPATGVKPTPGSEPSITSSISLDECVLLVLDLHALAGWYGSTFLLNAKRVIKVESGAVQSVVEETCNKLRGSALAVWKHVVTLLLIECRGQLAAVRAVAGRYRMTNRAAPTSPSAYVETVLAPMKTFITRYGETTATIAPRGPTKESTRGWDGDLIEEVTSSFLLNVNSVLETARQMDSALSRRAKATAKASADGSGGTAAAASDSDKIHIQLSLDVHAYERAITALGVNSARVPSLAALRNAVERKEG